MLNAIARGSVSKVTDPIGRGLLRMGLSPDLVTVIGTVGAVAASIALFPAGHLFWGTVAVTIFVFFDLFDGAMARARGYGTSFGLVLDASCDRIADGALFGSLAFYSFVTKHDARLGVACLIILVAGQVISYVKARADSVDLHVGGAIAERAERNVLGLVGAGLAGLGLTLALPICLWLLAAACLVTVVQRLYQVRTAAKDVGRAGAADQGAAGLGPASGRQR
ncbi:CDP-diacylglycerol--glycerol-3-phosphate 3-phosphatidyltransferase [Nakamurella sp. UYEF19]|uniref:phosphatidylinositol phosphate synthase n=1 Tax=Nakamurella sp. UYEF19 TaxID=1756392 RepID=UPI0033973A7F